MRLPNYLSKDPKEAYVQGYNDSLLEIVNLAKKMTKSWRPLPEEESLINKAIKKLREHHRPNVIIWCTYYDDGWNVLDHLKEGVKLGGCYIHFGEYPPEDMSKTYEFLFVTANARKNYQLDNYSSHLILL